MWKGKEYFTGEPIETMPPLPFGSTWRRNLYGIAADDANIVMLADGTVLDCTDGAEHLDWKLRDEPRSITHWTRVLPWKLDAALAIIRGEA